MILEISGSKLAGEDDAAAELAAATFAGGELAVNSSSSSSQEHGGGRGLSNGARTREKNAIEVVIFKQARRKIQSLMKMKNRNSEPSQTSPETPRNFQN